jgi:type II secretory pathway pseudopilin PulG
VHARGSPGYSLIEILVVTTILMTLYAITFPRVLAGLDESRVAGAARYMAARLADARMKAIQRSANVALRFTLTPDGYVYAVYLDANSNGVLSRDIQRGIDKQIQASEQLAYHFRGVDFGTLPELPPIDPGGSPPGSDPIRLGSGNILTFSPLGTSSSGSLYLLGRNNLQYVVRVFGDSGKIRVLRFDGRTRKWNPV